MTTINARPTLLNLMDKFGFTYCAIVSSDGDTIMAVGEPTPDSSNDLYYHYLHDSQAILVSFDLLKRSMSPRYIKQGTRRVILFQLTVSLVFGCVIDDGQELSTLVPAMSQLNDWLLSNRPFE